MAGRPPKPKALHLLQGTFRKDRHGDPEGGVNPAAGAEKPGDMEKGGRAEALWDKWAPILTRLGILTEIDSLSFGRLCRLWADEPELDSRERGPVLSEIRQLETAFGLNPASRMKLRTLAAPKPKSKMEKFRAG